MENSATVVTVTRGRVPLLMRAISSMQAQLCSGSIHHMIVIDNCIDTKNFLEQTEDLPKNLLWYWVERKVGVRSGPPILALLRNYAVQRATTKWVCYLDDDNEFEPNHLSSLINCATATGYEAVYSHRKLYYSDGRPYLEKLSPWCRDKQEAAQIYRMYCAEGIFEEGTNIVHDRILPWNHPYPAISTVDTGEWLLSRDLLLQFPFETEYTTQDWGDGIAEDGKFLLSLIKNRVATASTKMPTLKYYLGGYSTSFINDPAVNFWF